MILIPCFESIDQMAFYGFADGVCLHTLNLASTAWVLYSKDHELVSSRVVCIGPSTNNIVEYHAVIGFLIEDGSRDIDDLIVFMESQLVVSHLNHIYSI